MRYALLGDIHSSKEDLEIVLDHIEEMVPEATVFGTGDLYECTISKKDITDDKFTKLEQVMLNPKGFTELLDFPSVRGNQEERITYLTETEESLRKLLDSMPEVIELESGQIIHGHQWKWGGKPWSLLQANVENSLVFYGHSHRSALTLDGVNQKMNFGIPFELTGQNVLVNVGSVVDNREWVIYDSVKNTVTFMKA
ncbi:metallophosphoesterase family protein [Sporosarcina sp. Marseille-Q4063]|uniref:metallophosphoesterase family protein n=1 Tax=Sporosarcina sp. Marseille-Q4063 TaxID=2810514 RepID=UPI001BAF0226|nr:metallophosphoesterase family protein [Sporosarcina sp. Marseille-Q4063]QUW22152.1 metallophosphoesterase family protein [Sporosarcina sp. Marseille-Q4063]